MNTRVLAFTAVFAALMIAPKIVEPAYYFFLLAFAFLLGLQFAWRGLPLRFNFGVRTLVAATILLIILTVALIHRTAARDVLRDLGAVLAFVVGRYMFVAYDSRKLQLKTLEALSIMGVMVSVVTIGGALAAYLAGASAYVWRGVYVPWAHTWIPYALVTNVFLAQIVPERANQWRWRAALCVFATIASLSRTDVLLVFCFGLAMIWSFRRKLLLRFAGMMKVVGALALIALLTPFLLQLGVVQQRISRGIGDDDQSLGWRFMENATLYAHFVRGSTEQLFFGFGLGARLPLPPGVLDFNNSTSIATLHNSFGTIALKLGILGLVILAWYLWRITRRSFKLQDAKGLPYRRVGRWIVLMCLAKAMTLHGLTEWSHVMFFGIGSMLMLNHRVTETHTSDTAEGMSTDDLAHAR